MSAFVHRPRVRHGDRCAARAVLLALLALFTATFTGLPDNPDGEVAFQTTRSLARSASLAIGGTPEAERILDHARTAPPGGSSVRAGSGARADRYYAWFGIGQALAGVPFYWAGWAVGASLGRRFESEHERLGHYGIERSELFEHLFVGWMNPLATALTAWLLVLCALRLGARRKHAVLAALAYGTTTFAWPQSRSCLSDVPGAFWLVLSLHLILRVRESYDRLRQPSPRELVGLGAALGMALLTRMALGGAVVVLALWAVLVVLKGNRKLSASRWVPGGEGGGLGLRGSPWVLLPLMAAAALFAGTNAWRFGSVWDSGYGNALAQGVYFDFPLGRGLAGLFLSPGRGLLWMAPAVICAVFGLRRAWSRGERAWPLITLALGAAIVLPPAMSVGWHGGWTYGPRYLLPWLPFLWLGLPIGMEVLMDRAAGRVLLGGTLLFGLVVQVPAVLVDTMSVHELSVQAARLVWTGEGGPAADEEAARFEHMQWDPGFAAPWVHWRILRHRSAGLPESYPVAEIFRAPGTDPDRHLRPTFERDLGFRHFAWLDLDSRLRFPLWIPSIGILLLAVIALYEAGLATRSP